MAFQPLPFCGKASRSRLPGIWVSRRLGLIIVMTLNNILTFRFAYIHGMHVLVKIIVIISIIIIITVVIIFVIVTSISPLCCCSCIAVVSRHTRAHGTERERERESQQQNSASEMCAVWAGQTDIAAVTDWGEER